MMAGPEFKGEIAKPELRVSLYDRTNGWLVTALLIFGGFVVLVYLVLANAKTSPDGLAVPLTWASITDVEWPLVDTGEGPMSGEPIGDDSSRLSAMIEATTLAVTLVSKTERLGLRSQRVSGNRTGGLLWESITADSEVVPLFRRIRIDYNLADRQSYTRQLSFFGIKLGSVHRETNEILLLADPAGTARVERTDRQKERSSVHFGHTSPVLQRWDVAILQAANIDPTQSLIRQFYPPAILERLVAMEKKYLEVNRRELVDVQRTYFKVIPQGSGFEFVITGQTYRQ